MFVSNLAERLELTQFIDESESATKTRVWRQHKVDREGNESIFALYESLSETQEKRFLRKRFH
ncbi:hypothetical protein LBK6_02725 [Leptospira borgpetersenii serovar Hardjo]|nr:hypothetical protein LBK6_02725 [Leptospira borgpetersenii serovar Hardjo]AMX60560.1 hypothetical protein LBK9_02660 [Leptospira borgpetersenii serovar Hardjo]AMX63806.1 hypothetical protein LBK30_02720 [Leptospira borgpetersenii serovar Hardjo]AMX67046.1 hypothetical protein LBHA_02680 [Leptospira borgpetersenii serovar Hardjo]AMX72268.1 hypothetical protein LBHB_13850 [Leptospira borgpetersenii serovar Hardjo]